MTPGNSAASPARRIAWRSDFAAGRAFPAGGPIAGLTANELAFFNAGKADASEASGVVRVFNTLTERQKPDVLNFLGSL